MWTTNRRVLCLTDEIRKNVIIHVLENSKSKNIHIDHINGYYEHLHALISLGGTQNISDVMHLIKGESSYWINKNKLIAGKFQWQDDFYAVSIGMPQLENLRNYIRNQAVHHQKVTWDEEISLLEKEYHIVRFKG